MTKLFTKYVFTKIYNNDSAKITFAVCNVTIIFWGEKPDRLSVITSTVSWIKRCSFLSNNDRKKCHNFNGPDVVKRIKSIVKRDCKTRCGQKSVSWGQSYKSIMLANNVSSGEAGDS